MSAVRPLNVKDALSYLDQVKLQFSEQPEVYNQFLDIMKDFKSQAIDTPGVIDRVSNLFKGHPSLIQGFNTFLPPGYRIDTNPHEPNTIRVTTPSGTTSTSTGAPVDVHPSQTAQMSAVPNPTNSGYYPPNYPTSLMTPTIQPPPPNTTIQQQMATPYHISNTQQTASHNVNNNSQNHQQGKRAPVEFNHAINYVNKIKNRFSTEPDTYKQFLEILQTYQKEQKPILDVYAQVQVLFKNAPDLLDEFKQFLPDTSGNTPSGGLFGPPAQSHPSAQKSSHLMPVVAPLPNGIPNRIGARLPSVGNFGSSTSSSTTESFKKPTGQNGGASTPSVVSGALSPIGNSSIGKKKRGVNVSDRSPSASASKLKKSKTAHKSSDAHSSPTLAPVRSEPSRPPKQPASPDELLFFEKVKKYLSAKAFQEFLKVINLYSQRILDTNLVVDRVRAFLGQNQDLFEWFKLFVKYDDKDEFVQNTAFPRPRVDLEGARAVGPSYRQLPKSESQLQCSGRDEMCWEVLNDEWVSHPTWASEEAGFVAHKKNQYEEALHKCEEERYEYDMFIEANLHTIAILEPICKKISKMAQEEKSRYKLEPGFAGKSMIYQRVIKKVYDGDKAVLEQLHNNPSVAVPVILRRLKQKDDEWKRAQRDWNKIWREIDSKNYYKSLDHQGITFKTDDKRALNTKALVAEIEALRREPRDGPDVNEYQFKFYLKDQITFKDCVRVLFSYLDRSGSVTPTDRDRLEAFFKTFVSSFFDLPSTLFDGLQREDVEMMVDNDEVSEYKPMDILSNESLSAEHVDGMWIQMSKESKEDIRAVVNKAGHGKPGRKSTVFFCNSNFYCFFRLFQILYSRLEHMKEGATDRGQNVSPLSKSHNVAASELDVLNPRLDSDLDMDTNGDPYSVLLDLIDRLFDNELENTAFEDYARYIYGTKAYLMFTIDRLVLNLTRVLQGILADSKTATLINYFEKNRQPSDQSNVRPIIMYQLNANSAIGYDEHTFRLDFDKEDKSLSILLTGRDHYTRDAVTSEEKWAYYMYSYMSLNPTEGVSTKVDRPFLKRNLPAIEHKDPVLTNVSSKNGLEIKICINSYHVFFVNDTEDGFQRLVPAFPMSKIREDFAKRKDKFDQYFRVECDRLGVINY